MWVSVRRFAFARLQGLARTCLFALGAGLWLGLPVDGPAQSKIRNTITGYVFTRDRRPVSAVPVELVNETSQSTVRTRTDGSGKFLFVSLPHGRFTIKVLPLGTDLAEQSLELELWGRTSETVQRDFYLQPRKGRPPDRGAPGTVFAQEVPERSRKLFEKGVAEMDSGRKQDGLRLLLEALDEFPEHHAALERVAREYLGQNNFLYAKAAFLKLVSVNEKNFPGWLGLAFTAHSLRESAIAIEAAERAATLDPSSADPHMILGKSYRQLKNFAEAERALLRAKTLADGKLPDVHWNLALLYGNDMGRFAAAADALTLYLKESPPNINETEVNRLITHFRKKAESGGPPRP